MNDLFNQFLTTSKSVSKGTHSDTPTISIKASGGVDIDGVSGKYAVWYYSDTMATDIDALTQTATATLHFITTDDQPTATDIATALDDYDTHTALLACKSGTQIKFSDGKKAIPTLFFNYIKATTPEKVKALGKGYTATDDLHTDTDYTHNGTDYKHYTYTISQTADITDDTAKALATQLVEKAQSVLDELKNTEGTPDTDISNATDALKKAKEKAQSINDKITARTNKKATEKATEK